MANGRKASGDSIKLLYLQCFTSAGPPIRRLLLQRDRVDGRDKPGHDDARCGPDFAPVTLRVPTLTKSTLAVLLPAPARFAARELMTIRPQVRPLCKKMSVFQKKIAGGVEPAQAAASPRQGRGRELDKGQ
jgi:hypothetical protein